MRIRLLLAGLFVLCCSHTAFAQGSRYAPFIVDSGAVTATLRVKDSPLEERYAAVFTKHRLNASAPADWNRLLEQIAGIKETDLVIANEITFESTDENVELSAIHFDNLEQMVKSLRMVMATPEKTDAFLNDFEAVLSKKVLTKKK